jgi:hypothetical protein
MFCMDLGTNSDYFPIHYGQLVGFIAETKSVYYAVRRDVLSIIQIDLVFRVLTLT